MTTDERQVLTEAEPAEGLAISTAQLRRLRRAGQGPEHFRSDRRIIRFGRETIGQWTRGRSQPAGK